MPQMANITVKAANGTTDVVFVAKTPSAGDRSPATWSVDADSAVRSHRATFSAVTRFNGPKTARRVELHLGFPVVQEVNGVMVKTDTIPFDASLVLPLSITDSVADEVVARAGNLLTSALVRAIMSSGYSAT